MNIMGARRLSEALNRLSDAIRDVNAALNEMRAGHDPLAVHIFIARRGYRTLSDTKRETARTRRSIQLP